MNKRVVVKSIVGVHEHRLQTLWSDMGGGFIKQCLICWERFTENGLCYHPASSAIRIESQSAPVRIHCETCGKNFPAPF